VAAIFVGPLIDGNGWLVLALWVMRIASGRYYMLHWSSDIFFGDPAQHAQGVFFKAYQNVTGRGC